MATVAQDIPVAAIAVGQRLRQIDPAWVTLLQNSISAREAQMQPPLIHPVSVRPQDGGGYLLVAGGHRFAAVSGLGHATIQAMISPLTDLEARLEEIDENLIRNALSGMERAVFLAERRSIYEALYPDAKRGKKGALTRWHDATGKLPLAFTEDAATRAGLDVSVVRKILRTFDDLTAASRARIAGTWIADHDAQMRALSKCGPDMQARVLDVLLRDDAPAVNVAAAVAEIEGRIAPEITPDEAAFQALVRAWDRAEALPRARARFLEFAGLAAAAPKKKSNQSTPEAA